MDVIFIRQGEYKKGDDAFPLITEAVRQYLTLSGADDRCIAGLSRGLIKRTDRNRPYVMQSGALPGPPDISISHSGDIWMCLVSGSRCGVDFEYLRENDTRRISGRFFTQGESEYIEGGGTGQYTGSFLRSEEGRSGRFFDIWVRREALGKYDGYGFFGNYPDSAPGGIPAESVYFIGDTPSGHSKVYIHDISKSMLAHSGIKTEREFRSAAVTQSEEPPLIRLI